MICSPLLLLTPLNIICVTSEQVALKRRKMGPEDAKPMVQSLGCQIPPQSQPSPPLPPTLLLALLLHSHPAPCPGPVPHNRLLFQSQVCKK
jgi:hypothetical protein